MRARVLQTPRSRRTCSGAAPSATDETSGAGVRLPRSPVRSRCAPCDSHVCGGGSASLMTSIMRRECGGGRLQAPRHLLEDLCSTNDARYAIESGRDFGSPPFSLDFGQSKHAGILVRIPRPAALLSTSWLLRRVFARPRRRKTSSRLGAPAAPFAATQRPALVFGERAGKLSHAFNVRGCCVGAVAVNAGGGRRRRLHQPHQHPRAQARGRIAHSFVVVPPKRHL